MRIASWNVRGLVWKHYAFDSIQVEANERSGGLVSMWRTDIFSLLMSWKRKHWSATIVRYLPSNLVILIVNVYAPRQESRKKMVWDKLTNIALKWPGPLCFLGDFNAVCSPEERFREATELSSIANFNDFITNASLIDQPLSNDVFTWEGPRGKFSRIDRFLVNHEWVTRWPEEVLQTVNTNKLYHKPIV
ncbi:uncharacterized protein [Rutidosis leptorrhynchoides]|uniref:uncharacterized protein n=1 Tax=Rutidosis leptorrhynchoides TaxID=125765 RepID=UPI003A9A5EDF